MISLSSVWLVLLGIREILAVYQVETFFLSLLITLIQLFHLLLGMEREKLILSKYHFILVILCCLTLYNKATLATVNILLSVLLLKNMALRRIIKLVIIIYIMMILCIILSLRLGILENQVHLMPKGVGNTFGFANTNGLGEVLFSFSIVLSLYFLVYKYRNIYAIFFTLVLIYPNYLIYKLTLGRTSFYTVLIYSFFCIYFLFLKKSYLLKSLLLLLPIILYGLTYFCCFIYEQYPIIDKIFTTRFSKNSAYLFAMTPLHYVIGFRLPEGKPMDSAFLAQLFSGGFLSVFVFLSFYYNGIKSMSRRNAKKILPYILCLLCAGFVENAFSTFSLQTVLFYKLLCIDVKNMFISWRKSE